MCRLYGMIASDPTKVECTLIHAQNALMIQSRSDLSGVSHTDGWGIGYYSNCLPKVERRATAAYTDLHFASTVEKVYARVVLAHVRRATVGGVSTENTHPFNYGRWTFAHNGTVSAFSEMADVLARETLPNLRAQRVGSTDSEASFYWMLSRLSRAGIDIESEEAPDTDRLLEAFRSGVHRLAVEGRERRPDQVPRLNFLLTNGRVLLASRLNRTLFRVERDGIHDCEICGIPHIHAGKHPYRAVVLASEQISAEPWQAVPDAHTLLVTPKLEVHVSPLGLESAPARFPPRHLRGSLP